MVNQRLSVVVFTGALLAGTAMSSAQSTAARTACSEAARALVGQQASWDGKKASSSEVLRWRAVDGSQGFCRIDSSGRVYGVEVEQWGSGDDVWVGDDHANITTERDRDRRGSDYTSFSVRSLEGCQSSCLDDDRCRAYSWSEREAKCWLKSSAPASQVATGIVTGVKGVTGGNSGGSSGGSWDGGVGVTTERDHDRRGGDYSSFGVRSLEGCQSSCVDDDRCRAYSWSEREAKCWLKSSASASQYASGIVSGVRTTGGSAGSGGSARVTTERGSNRGGSDYSNFQVRSLAECQDACVRDSRCQAYTLNVTANRCYLKDRVPPARSDPDTVSGYRER